MENWIKAIGNWVHQPAIKQMITHTEAHTRRWENESEELRYHFSHC